MGRSKKYATEAEAKEAKKAQMRAAYQRRKAARSTSPNKEDTPKEAPNTIQEAVANIVSDEPKPRKLKISEKARLWDELEQMVTNASH